MRRHYHSSLSSLTPTLSSSFSQSHHLPKPLQLINPNTLSQLLNFSFTQITLKFCSFFSSNPNSSPHTRRVADELIHIFTQKKNDPNTHIQLSRLGSRLSHEIVEYVLKGIKNETIAVKFFNWAKTQEGYFHNCYTYNALASLLSSVRRNASMKDLALDLIESRCTMSPGALGYFIRRLGSLGMVDEANLLFDQVRELGLCVPNSYSYNCLLEAISKSSLSSSSSLSYAERRLDEMLKLGWEVDKYTITPLLQVYCNANEFDKALSCFNQMFEKGWVDSHVLSILAVSFSKWGEVDKAFELIEKMVECNVTLNEKTFCVLVHGFVASSKVDTALQLYEKRRDLGCSANIGVYDVLIGGFCKQRKPHKAMQLYSNMKVSGISPDHGILLKLITAADEEEVMAQLLEENKHGLDDESVKLLYNPVLNGLIRIGFIDKALNLIKIMIEDKPQYDSSRVENFFKVKGINCLSSSSFSIIINALCRNRRLDEALLLFGAMDKVGCQKDTLLYNTLIDALSNADRVSDSLHLLGEMKQSGIERNGYTYNSIYGYYCRKGDIIEATSMVKEMCLYKHEPRIKNSITLVKQLCRHGRVEEASKFLAKMVEEGLVPHLILYSAAIDGFFKLQKVDQALELFHSICTRGYRPDVVTYNILINGLCKADRMPVAENMLKEMLAQKLVPSTITYNSLIHGWCKNGNIDEALVCYSNMAGKDREPDVITYTTLIDGLCNTGRPHDALMLWKEMEVKACCPNRIAFMALISGLSKNGMPEVALPYLREMEKREMTADNYVYIVLIDSLLLNKNSVLALGILKMIVDKKLFPDPVDQNHTILKNAIAKLCDDPLTSCNARTLLAEAGIPIVSECDVNAEAE